MNYSSKVDEYNKQVHGIEKKDYSELVERLVSIKEDPLTTACAYFTGPRAGYCWEIWSNLSSIAILPVSSSPPTSSPVNLAPVPDGVNSDRIVGLIGEAHAIIADS